MRPTRLDHVAVNVFDPGRVAAALLARLPFRVLQETEDFTLVGRRPDLGKLTLVRSQGPTERGSLLRIGIAVPCAVTASGVDVGGELDVELVPGPREGEVDLDHLALLVRDPCASSRGWLELGFEREERIGCIERVRLGEAIVELHPGAPDPVARPSLAHVGLLVESLDDVRPYVADRGFELLRDVEAENSRALFVSGPDGVEVELVEQLPSFALV